MHKGIYKLWLSQYGMRRTELEIENLENDK